MSSKGKGYFAKHAKSSAALVSLAVHVILIVIATSFVAVSVIMKEEANFQDVPVKRPKMTIKKLQIPVDIRKRKQKPKLIKRLVVQPKVNMNMLDIKMPEFSGVKGGLGSLGDGGLGGSGGVGFDMPEIDIFGIKSKGEKVFIMLDASDDMMYDEMGGIPAYTIIKKELVKIIGGLPATTLFNVVVFDHSRTHMLFPKLVVASSANVEKVDQWLTPLNAVRPGMGANEWGPKTLGPGGERNYEDLKTGDFQRMELWHQPTMLAMKQQADAVFLLTSWWGYQRYVKGERDKAWIDTSVGKRYLKKYAEAVVLYDEECRKRVDSGQAPRVLNRNDKRLLVNTYFPGTPLPPEPEFYYHKPAEYIEGMLEVREKYKPNAMKAMGGFRKKKGKVDCSFNVIRFVRVGAKYSEFRDGRSVNNFKKITGYFKGNYHEIAGLSAIKSNASGD